MKAGLVVVVTLILSAFAAHFLLEDPGYVVINFRSWVIEMSVPVLIGLFLGIVVTAWTALKVLQAPRKLGRAAGRFRSERAGQKLTKGMIQIAEGNFARGEKLLVRAADVSDAPLLNYLQAARAAHLLGQDQRRDDWLKQAYEDMPEAANAVLLTQAEFQIDQKQYESALATLRRIEETTPNHSHAVSLLGRLYFRLEDWRHLGELLPRLRKHGRLDAETLEEWSMRVHEEELAAAGDEQEVRDRWSSVPKDLRRNDRMLVAYYGALVRVGAHGTAEKGIIGVLRRRWIVPLVGVFGSIESEDARKQLKRAEGWLEDHPDDPELLLTAARLCLKNELWGKARSYLESVLSIKPTPEAYQEYGRLLNQLGEGDAAADAYRQGLGLVSSPTLKAIPHLDARPDANPDGDSEGRQKPA